MYLLTPSVSQGACLPHNANGCDPNTDGLIGREAKGSPHLRTLSESLCRINFLRSGATSAVRTLPDAWLSVAPPKRGGVDARTSFTTDHCFMSTAVRHNLTV